MRVPVVAFLLFFTSIITAQAKPNVVTSIMPVHSLVANVMEGVGDPTLLIKGAASPHAYSLTPSDAAALESAERIFWIGPGLESFLVRIMRNLEAHASVPLMTQSSIELLPFREAGAFEAHAHGDHDANGHDEHAHADHDEHGHDEHDGHDEHEGGNPHVWLDPHVAMRLVKTIADELSEVDPDNAAQYEVNARGTIQRLEALDARLAAHVAPVRDLPYVVFHDAYQYFEARYGLSVVGSISLDAEDAPGARRLYEIRNKIVDTKATCVFAEPQFEPDLVYTVIEGTGAQAGVLDPLGASLTPGPDAYFALLENLAESLRECLHRP